MSHINGHIEFIPEIGSTNSELLRRAAAGEPLTDWLTLCTYRQTAGRGQRGNGWESEPDKNVSFTTVLPTAALAPEQLPRLSMVVPLAVALALQGYHLPASVKWPNDIYVGDEKICGILIENILQGGHIAGSIAGIGVNINQRLFVSNAPNPTSMALLAGHDFDKQEVLCAILYQLQTLWPLVTTQDEQLHHLYMQHLYRRNGLWLWRERAASAAPMAISHERQDSFEATIKDVNNEGQLLLQQTDGSIHAYNFKEIQYII